MTRFSKSKNYLNEFESDIIYVPVLFHKYYICNGCKFVEVNKWIDKYVKKK